MLACVGKASSHFDAWWKRQDKDRRDGDFGKLRDSINLQLVIGEVLEQDNEIIWQTYGHRSWDHAYDELQYLCRGLKRT